MSTGKQASASSREATWVVESGTVRLRTAAGKLITPGAMEILRAEFKGLERVCGEWVSVPGQDLDGIRISRFPGALKLGVTKPGEGNRFRGTWRLATETGHEVTFGNLEDGHLCVGPEWLALAAGDVEEARKLIRDGKLDSSGSLSLGSFIYLLQRRESHILEFWEEPATAEAGDLNVPGEILNLSGLQAKLYRYQESGIRWLVRLSNEGLGGILADEMGLGKTLQVIALFLSELAAGRRQHLVVAPVTLIENWRREICKFAPSIQPLVHQGRLRTGFPKDLEGADVVLTSYDTVLRDQCLLEMVDWGVVVLDEAQAVKNPHSQRTSAVKALRRRVGFAVTGTPVENRLLDLWSIMDFVVPRHLGTEAEFVSRYLDCADDAAALEPLVTPLILRRRVGAVAKDLPERIDIPQILTLSDQEAEAYEAVRLRTIEEFPQAAGLVSLTRLRMFCAHPRLSQSLSRWDLLNSVKLARLLEILDEIFESGEKALVFTSYNGMADIICKVLTRELGAGSQTLDGRRPLPERQPLIDRFASDKSLQCLVLNPKAAGAGLNITTANHVIHYNPEWNPAVEDQASARSYRRGQTLPVTVHRLILADTVEEVMHQRLKSKRELAEKAVVGGTGEFLYKEDIIRALTMSPLCERKAQSPVP